MDGYDDNHLDTAADAAPCVTFNPAKHRVAVPVLSRRSTPSNSESGSGPLILFLPAKWSSFFWLRQQHFPSHRQHGYSMCCATLPRFLSGSVVNPVVRFSP
jgi:hypothetical protein